MQVLLKNPLAVVKVKDLDLLPSFWSEECWFMGPRFSMSSLMEATDPLGLSPYLVVNAQVALLLSLLDKKETTLVQNLGPLGSVGVFLFTEGALIYREDESKVKQYLEEYVGADFSLPEVQSFPDQMIVYGENTIRMELWDKLQVGGTLILGSSRPIMLDSSLNFEAVGKLYPLGEATEFGWRFDEENLGLEKFEIVKVRKLA